MNGWWLAWVSVLVLVPGLAATFAAFGPGHVSFPTRLALVFALGYVVTGGVGFLLTLLHGMRPVPFFVVLGVVTALLATWAARRWGWRVHLRALIGDVKESRWVLATAGVVLVWIAVVRLGFLSGVPVAAPLRYWVDGMKIADAGQLPRLSLEYGQLYPPAASKIFLNSFTAGVSFAVGRNPIIGVASVLWIVSTGLGIALWSAAWELGLRYTAALFPVLTIANRAVLSRETTNDLVSYRAEDVGRMVAFAALALALHSLRRRKGWTSVTVSGVLLATAAGTHLVPVVVVVAIVVWYGLARLVLDRAPGELLRRGLALGGITAVVGLAVLLLPRGDIGFQGAQSPSRYAQSSATFDETRYLYTGVVTPPREPTAFYVPPPVLVSEYAVRSLGVRGSVPHPALFGLFLAAGGLGLAVIMLLVLPPEVRAVGLVAWGLGATLFLGALAFSFRYDVYVPALFGINRLYDYAAFPVVIGGLGLVEAGVLLLGRVRPWAPSLVAGLLVIGLSAWIVPTSRASPRIGQNAEKAVAFVNWVREGTPCDARILSNQRTVGVFAAMTGRVGVLEGMGPFLRPDILSRVVKVALEARAFYADPAAHRPFLVGQGVDYVVALSGLRLGYGGPIGRFDHSALDRVPFLELVQRTKQFTAYRVIDDGAGPRVVDPSGQPGYRCETEAISR